MLVTQLNQMLSVTVCFEQLFLYDATAHLHDALASSWISCHLTISSSVTSFGTTNVPALSLPIFLLSFLPCWMALSNSSLLVPRHLDSARSPCWCHSTISSSVYMYVWSRDFKSQQHHNISDLDGAMAILFLACYYIIVHVCAHAYGCISVMC